LAATAALEHITAIMADGLLRNGGYIADALPTLARLWRWHALEETEHKAVAFDVYNQVCGSRKLLRRAMFNGTFFFVLDRWMWGKEGVFRPLISTYLDFFKDGFPLTTQQPGTAARRTGRVRWCPVDSGRSRLKRSFAKQYKQARNLSGRVHDPSFRWAFLAPLSSVEISLHRLRSAGEFPPWECAPRPGRP
jgi:hypothetical protein